MTRTLNARSGLRAGLAGAAVLAVVFGITPAASAHKGVCGLEALNSALAAAVPGDTVRIASRCTITVTNVTVPAGVTLSGGWRSRIKVPVNELGIVLDTDAGHVTRLQWLHIKSDGYLAVQVIGDGTGVIDFTRLKVRRGAGIAAELAADVRIKRSAIQGSVTARNASSVPEHAAITDYATHGIVMSQVGNVDVSWVSVRGFARFGMLFAECDADVRHTWISGNVGVGAMAHGGSIHLAHSVVSRTYRGIRPADEHPTGFAFAAGATVSTEHTVSSRSEGMGLFHDGTAEVSHHGLRASRNAMGGVIVQSAASLSVTDSDIGDNGLAGILAIDSGSASVSDTEVAGTTLASLAGVPAGDGIQLQSTSGAVTDVSLVDNERAGFIGALGPAQFASDIQFQGVTASGFGESLGVVLQQFQSPLETVVDGVERFEPLLGNDIDWFVGGVGLGEVGVQQPCFLPEPIQILDQGLASLFLVTA